MTLIFVPKEAGDQETRVAGTPETVKKYVAEGFSVSVESGAGEKSNFSDEVYQGAGATIGTTADWERSDLVLTVTGPSEQNAARMKQGAILIGLLTPHRRSDLVRKLRDGRVSSLAMELVPRISRAQSMDALSSQASIGGYKAVLLAASRLGKYFPLLMTAAGTIKPARVVVMGAGVAGLQAIATAKRLGSIVEVSDIRPAVKEQVESLGGKFIELPMEESGEGAGGYAKEMGEDFLRKQREIVARHVSAADVVITTAQIPGRKAPTLVTEEMVKAMRKGAVIVDLAVDSGGNCEISEPEREIERHGVHILGYSNLPATVPEDASTLYSRNVYSLLGLVKTKEGGLTLNLEDEVIDSTLLTHDGVVRHAPTAALLEGQR
ncbi:MAG: Re/Si-specific NAD(P)(+) transhydrogenase subunit alpha [Acidobacteria bacterium]|nr:Re/Si-specific NAD(P)(+) transhydrogenase subunit alpha [Acidobacteriota bacterium]